MRVLVTGGAGYIGSHLVDLLQERGDDVLVVDDLSAGRRDRIPRVPVLQLDLASADAAEVLALELREEPVDAIVHLAARKRVDESLARPDWYRRQNVGGLRAVLDAATALGITRLVFSSTAAVYAASPHPVREEDATAPGNPYGETKLEGERLVDAFATATGARALTLRYFNVAGAARPELADTGAHNLVPMVYDRIERGEPPRIFGDDYDTADGTCIRDYVHVVDVAEAHLAALDGVAAATQPHRVYNIGSGAGSSVRAMVAAMLRISGSPLEPVVLPRRPGDPDVVVADVARIAAELGWRARFDVEQILDSAWRARAVRRD